MSEDKTSIIKWLGVPDAFAVVLLTFSFVLFLAPYFSGADFGLFKIPQFTGVARKKLKIFGPMIFLALLILFVPLVPHAPKSPPNGSNSGNSNGAERSSNSNPGTPEDVHTEVKQHLTRAGDLYQQREYKDAIEECEKALSREPGNQDALELKTTIQKRMKILNQ